ncbi:type II secretion system ATPase GspE [Hydrogenophaga taeniospiralis]|uniref:type II secretion system ATPase GspE n=1 Tax=Hydrogenophaga taeniospiralis TaxID=65656 RepID=UPI001CFA1878|nr:type II secretion system ATPase GspE [Hydrogenophaga taeniospiralis]MCB4365490.1 type II secretion system ATPase GspE [Hydrogenophaga taeniospiralis]
MAALTALAAGRIPYLFARRHGVLLHPAEGGDPVLWVCKGTPVAALAEVRRAVGPQVPVRVVPDDEFSQALTSVYADGADSAASIVDTAGQEVNLDQLVNDLPPVEDLLASDGDAPVIRLINALIAQAVREGASDIHIEPEEQRTVVRMRRDGELVEVLAPHRALHAAMSSRIKILAQLDIAEKRLPQDGRIAIRLAGKTVDVRVSTVPTSHGERVVMRLLDKDPKRMDLAVLGMAPDTLASFDTAIHAPHGIVLVTGPTGSGKTTTLYGALMRMNSRNRNIMTVEDPVEYDLAGIGQVQIHSRIDMTFARALRALLRQDPDVVMIGEIRDLETAQIAIQASLTGHLVLATVHTNDSVSAITRLVDMGVEPFLLASSLIGVLAQRLVRQLCPHCKEPDPVYADAVSEEQGRPFRPRGCPACRGTGYSGRLGIYEWLSMDDRLRRLVHDGAGEHVLRDSAREHNGLRLLQEDGQRWVRAGVTSVDELMRVAGDR